MCQVVHIGNGLSGNMIKILLFGEGGQVGWELKRSLLPLGELTAPLLSECNLSDKEKLKSVIQELSPDIIVNAAAYTAVDKAEEDVEMAMCINAEAPAIMAEEAKKINALLIDYSTDYVFDGSKLSAYVETDAAGPVNIYGSSKLAGLKDIEESGCRYLVFRVSWVYGFHGQNFVKTMLRLAKEKTELQIVDDQVGSPTPADLIADVTAMVISLVQNGKNVEGVFNLVPVGSVSWCGFAEAIFNYTAQLTNETMPNVIPIESSEYRTLAKRPLNSCLNTEKLKNTFGFYMPDWRIPLNRLIEKEVKI